MARPNITKEPPYFAKNAIPSPEGWRDPKTNELLVAVKLDMAQFKKKKVVKEVKEPKKEVKEEPKMDTKSIDQKIEIKQEKPRIRRRRK